MVNANILYTETDEARALREAFNARSQVAHSAAASDENKVEFTCPAGVVLVDLTELEKQDNPTSFLKARKLSFATVSAAALNSMGRDGRRPSLRSVSSDGRSERSGPSMRHLGNTTALVGRLLRWTNAAVRRDELGKAAGWTSKGGRRWSDSSAAGTGSASSKGEHDNVALELVQYVVEEHTEAELAKQAATRSAQMRESYVAQELQVRQMWRVVMGNAPGLKAEIAKLHATERAKLALREFELHQRQRRAAAQRASVSVTKGHTKGQGSGLHAVNGHTNGHATDQHENGAAAPPPSASTNTTSSSSACGGEAPPSTPSAGAVPHDAPSAAADSGGRSRGGDEKHADARAPASGSSGLFGWLHGGRRGTGRADEYESSDAGSPENRLVA